MTSTLSKLRPYVNENITQVFEMSISTGETCSSVILPVAPWEESWNWRVMEKSFRYWSLERVEVRVVPWLTMYEGMECLCWVAPIQHSKIERHRSATNTLRNWQGALARGPLSKETSSLIYHVPDPKSHRFVAYGPQLETVYALLADHEVGFGFLSAKPVGEAQFAALVTVSLVLRFTEPIIPSEFPSDLETAQATSSPKYGGIGDSSSYPDADSRQALEAPGVNRLRTTVCGPPVSPFLDPYSIAAILAEVATVIGGGSSDYTSVFEPLTRGEKCVFHAEPGYYNWASPKGSFDTVEHTIGSTTYPNFWFDGTDYHWLEFYVKLKKPMLLKGVTVTGWFNADCHESTQNEGYNHSWSRCKVRCWSVVPYQQVFSVNLVNEIEFPSQWNRGYGYVNAVLVPGDYIIKMGFAGEDAGSLSISQWFAWLIRDYFIPKVNYDRYSMIFPVLNLAGYTLEPPFISHPS